MAAIDKTYGTRAQGAEMFNWLKRHRPKFLRYHYGGDSYDHLSDEYERPVVNTPVSADKWLARHCPLPFVLRRILEVYDPRHVAARHALAALTPTTDSPGGE